MGLGGAAEARTVCLSFTFRSPMGWAAGGWSWETWGCEIWRAGGPPVRKAQLEEPAAGPPVALDSARNGTVPETDAVTSRLTVSDVLNEAPTSRFHHRAVVISGMGFFTDAYDLFVIGTVAVLVKAQWHLSTTQTSWVTGSAILAAFVGAMVFGRIADVLGRKVCT